MELEQALAIVKAAGYRVSKPRAKKELQTVNPFNHPFPHAKLKNATLTSINRLSAYSGRLSRFMIENNDPRNYTISRRAEA